MICAGCDQSDRLYTCNHGTFCSRCGPSVPMKPLIKWYAGMTVDADGKIHHYRRTLSGKLEEIKD